MTCSACGAWSPGDPSTGYDADDLCPRCVREGWTLTASGELVWPDDVETPVSDVSDTRVRRPRMARAALRSPVIRRAASDR